MPLAAWALYRIDRHEGAWRIDARLRSWDGASRRLVDAAAPVLDGAARSPPMAP
jgi:hypothetical protein